MPITEFARMRRSDHSMLPPTPAATLAFQSPNACNLCHRDRDAAWADRQVRMWHEHDYQGTVLERAGLIDAARKQEWQRLPEMLSYLEREEREEIYAVSLIRLMRSCNDASLFPVLRTLLNDPSPLVRAGAASALAGLPTSENVRALLSAVEDPVRLVRVHAAMALTSIPGFPADTPAGSPLEQALTEYLDSLTSRPDHWVSQYNLGNYHMNRGAYGPALAAFEKAASFEPHSPLPRVNGAMVHARLGDNFQAETWLNRALASDPENAAAHYNLGLLLAEKGDRNGAETRLRSAVRFDPRLAEARYNLGILLAGDRPEESLQMMEAAYGLQPNPKIGYSLAYYRRQQGDLAGAETVLQRLMARWPTHVQAALLLGDLYEKQGKWREARQVLRRCLGQEGLGREEQILLQRSLSALNPPPP